MRLRNVKNAEEILNNSKYFIPAADNLKGTWKKVFNNQNKICLEIGMGKGDFLINMAKKYPNVNFIGIERYESVLVRAVQKLEEESILNVKVMCLDAIKLDNYIYKEIDTLFLNFSDPWPKKRHYKRRLTYRDYLKVYDNLFEKTAKLEFKTDNDGLFESSLIELNNYGYKFSEIHLDLWSTGLENVRTEYENKFGNMGYTIKQVKAYKEI